MTYANWRFGISPITDVRCTFHLDNDPGRSSDLYLQLYDAPIDGTGTYHGVQTIDLAIFSRFGTVDVGEVRPARGAWAVAGTDEGPFVSLRMEYRLGAGSFATVLRRAEQDGAGDWFEFLVERLAPVGDGAARPPDSTLVGAIRFPRRSKLAPAALADGGGSWTEYWPNNGPVLLPVPLWKVRLDPPVANRATPAEGVTLSYSRMPNAVIAWDSSRGQVVTTIGGDTLRERDDAQTLRLR